MNKENQPYKDGTHEAKEGSRGARGLGSKLVFPEVEPWPEPVDGQELLNELTAVMKRFVVLPNYAAEALALWTLHTYAFELREVSTYIGVESPEKRCGKTTLLSVLSGLAHRTVAAANISSSAMFRVIEETQPTLLIDEADTFLQGNDELRGILNSGYTRQTAYVVRVAQQTKSSECRVKDGDEGEVNGNQFGESNQWGSRLKPEPRTEGGPSLVRFSCWCPKVMAAIGRLPDTLADRCIVIRMERKMPGEECERLRFLKGLPLRRKCARFVRDNGSAIAQAQPQIPPQLNDRAGDIWEPLLALADIAGGEWPAKARAAAEGLTVRAHGSNPSASLLLDILYLFVVLKTARIFSRNLVATLNTFLHRPWMEARDGKPITEIWLSQQLRSYGVRPKTMRINGEMAKGYSRLDFKDVFRRYIPMSELERLKEEEGVSGGKPGD